jgi:hypothetical protein
MAQDITSSEYWSEITSIAENVKQDVRENEGDVSDAVHEAIDGHQWVIYTGYHFDVLRHCSDESAGIDEGLIDANAALADGGLSRLTAQLAYCAMERDVYNELDGWSGPEDDDEPDAEATERDEALEGAENEYAAALEEETGSCDSCAVAMINGVRCHETGCPRYAEMKSLESRVANIEAA